ncbi:MAG: glycosyltransferase family 39 protein [bacterium]|nr:glycosyltransferase family 39 protein [bacterium]
MRVKILVFILFIGAILRTWGLDRVPLELFGDELDVGYHAYSILNTGKDYYGQTLPTYIHSFSEWRAPLLMYATAPFVAVFGLNEWGVRLPSAVFGIISIFLLYLLVDRTLKNKTVALLAALILAVSPWHLQYSRAAFEVSLLLVLILGGTLSFLRGLQKPGWLLAATVLFALTFYTYSTANVFTPLFVLLLLLLHRKEVVSIKRKLVGPLIIFVILIIPISYHILFGKAAERFGNFSIFSGDEVVSEINIKRAEKGPIEGALFYNKPIVWGRKILGNYATAFSPQFLFIEGDVTFRHSVHTIGELYWIQLPFLIAGLVWFLGKRDKRLLFWLGWLLLAPLPASLTRDGSIHATRLILMLPPLTVLTAGGLNLFLDAKWKRAVKKTVLALILFAVLVELSLYINRYWVDYPRESWRWWHVGYKEAMLFMKENEKEYDIFAFNNTYEPSLIRFLFWWKYPPDKFLQEFSGDKPEEGILPGFNGFSVGSRYYFGSMGQDLGVVKFAKPNILYLVSQRDEVPGDWDWEKDPPAGITVLKTVRNPYSEPIFYVVTGEGSH